MGQEGGQMPKHHRCSLPAAPPCAQRTLPVGLCGVLSTTSRVLLLKAAASSAGSRLQAGGCSCTMRGTAPARRAMGRYESYSGSKKTTCRQGLL